MHNLKPSIRTAALGLFAISCLRLIGQAPAAGPPHLARTDQFGAIHQSLAETADSILESATARGSRSPDSTFRDSGSASPEAKTNPDQPLQRGNSRSDSLRSLIRPILLKQGVPDNLAAVMLVESGGNPLALSPKGARGLWQLMPETARRYGLTVDDRQDDRVDLEKSTETAARYLRDLHLQFGDWALALAAYNTGEMNVQRAIARARSREFQTLSVLGYLPTETRKYVPAVLAAMGSGRQFVFQSQPVEPLQLVYALSGQ